MSEYDDCLQRRKLVKSPVARKLVERELDVARSDLSAAGQSLKLKNYKWATVQAYYAMFHAARTLLFYKGYREKSHYCLILAMKEFYVKEKVLPLRLVESLQMAKAMREEADYDNTFDPQSAKALVAQAGEFLAVAEGVVPRS